MKPCYLVLSLVLFSLTLLGCAAAEDEETPVVTFATYNAGLAEGFVDYAEQRTPFVEEAIKALDADVLCLNEVWYQDQVEDLVAKVKDSYPHAYWESTEGSSVGGGDPSCDLDLANAMAACVTDACPDVDPGELVTCALGNCGDEFNATSADCQTCIASNLGAPMEDILATCTSGGGGAFAYDANNGLIILSKLPISSSEHVIMDSYLTLRAVLKASVVTNAFGAMDIYCTHLTADLSKVDYHGESDSWEKEQGDQIDTMLNWITEKSGSETPAVLLGDMNCGPKKANVAAEYPENYKKFSDAGLSVPYIADEASTCTWCGENPLTGGADAGGEGSIIDHVMFDNMPEGVSYESSRIMDAEITFTFEEEDLNSRASDHYGVSVTASP